MFALNLPNVLTLLRILLVPVLVVVLLGETQNGDLWAAIVFAVASATDAMDGYLARSRNAITSFGKLMDPIADKLLIIAALVSLVSVDRLAPWVAMVIIARELTVTVTRMQATQHGLIIASSWWGKAKTIVQVAAIFFLIAAGDPSPVWVDGLVYGAVAITIVSGLDYFFGLRRVLREADARREASGSATAAETEPTAP
ncbi:MAG TPA: CDP-diacylglycerol--glycerol-3-phosphate 3-phosphatidyltransferase [Solirubrobacteraceae bacterium]|nr:CDP-diacylglycerol--glycerol-3-phosphate 3-phosphatidyltransferase [Solirubrobacteraceae bacterium]